MWGAAGRDDEFGSQAPQQQAPGMHPCRGRCLDGAAHVVEFDAGVQAQPVGHRRTQLREPPRQITQRELAAPGGRAAAVGLEKRGVGFGTHRATMRPVRAPVNGEANIR